MIKRIVLLVTLALVAIALVPARAHAQGAAGSAEARAKTLYQNGEAFVAKGKYREALTAFSQAYTLSKRPLLLFNMAECTRQLGDLERARELYQRYLDAEPQGQLADAARQRMAALPRPAAPPPVAPAVTAPPPPPPPAPAPAPVVITPPRAAPPPAAAPPSPAVAARAATVPEPAGRDLVPVEQKDTGSRPLWKRTGFWIGVGVVAALATGSIVLYARSQGGDDWCNTPACADLH
jgi:hypothetical protein